MKKTTEFFEKVTVLPASKMIKLKGGGKIKEHKPKGD